MQNYKIINVGKNYESSLEYINTKQLTNNVENYNRFNYGLATFNDYNQS